MTGTGIVCRRCGGIAEDQVVIWRPDKTGALTPQAAQCRGRCKAATPQARANPFASAGFGKCGACGRDVLPGDVIVRTEDGHVHYECAPPEAPPAQSGRYRQRSRRVSGEADSPGGLA